MQHKVSFGTITKQHKLDDEGSTVKTTIASFKNIVKPKVKLEYSVRHRIEHPEDENLVHEAMRTRQGFFTLFDVSVSYEGKNKLQPKPYYYMVEHFTMYRDQQDAPHISMFIEKEKSDLGL